jgi:Tfp pilus assembly protein PilX
MMKRNDGIVLVVTLLIMVVVMILVGGTMFTSMIDSTVARNQRGANAAYYAAQAGLHQYKTLIFRNLVDYYADEGKGWCESPVAGGIRLDETGSSVHVPGTSRTAAFGDGSYTVTYNVSDTYLILTSVGLVGTSQATVQLVATTGAGPSGTWDNAIFASGTAPGSKAINGNVSVYGAVHIVEGFVEIQEDFAVSGTAGVYNNYVGDNGQNNSDITSKVSAVTGMSLAEAGSLDLCSRLKIARGDVYLESSSSRVGTTNHPIYSVHLGRGKVYHGKPSNRVEVTDHHDSARINLKYPADEGMNSSYQGHELEMPALHASYPNEIPGALNVTTNPNCAWLIQTIKENGQDIVSVSLPPASPSQNRSCQSDDGTSKIEWIAGNPGYFKIQGNVNTGALPLRLNGPLQYEGRGNFRAGTGPNDTDARMRVTGAVTPRNGGYPETNGIALISSGNIRLRATAGDQTMALVAFAKGTIAAEQQPIIVGSMVGTYFDLGTNVPKVAYHPGVRDFAESMCLPGSFCAEGEVRPNPGLLSDISIERR